MRSVLRLGALADRARRRIESNVRTGRRLLRAGVTPSSVLLYPIRRRLRDGHNRLSLRGGHSLVAPVTEPLLETFREVWIERRYAEAGFDVAPGETVVDIGAHIGVFCVWTASQQPAARIIAVEPSPASLAYLERNVDANRMTNVSIAPVACGAVTGRALLHLGPYQLTNSLYRRHADSEGGVSVEVELVTLADLFLRYDVGACAFLKLDCEGAEYDILLAAGDDTLGRVRRIAMEYHVGITPHGPEALLEHLTAHGFEARADPSPKDPIHGYLFAYRR